MKIRESRYEELVVVENLSVQGLSIREVSRIVGYHFSTVSRIFRKLKTKETLQKSRRNSQPKKLILGVNEWSPE